MSHAGSLIGIQEEGLWKIFLSSKNFEFLGTNSCPPAVFRYARDWFHPSQSLLNHFRELQAAVVEIQQLIDQFCEFLALFLDLAKALKDQSQLDYIDLVCCSSPHMSILFVDCCMVGIQHKIQGYLMPSRLVYSGVDMGRLSSVPILPGYGPHIGCPQLNPE